MATLEDEYLRRNTLARREGLAEGLAKGAADERERLNKLTAALIVAERIDDLRRAAEDTAFQQLLLEEFGLA